MTGWPTFDAAGYYTGPLPRCGHRHKQKTIGRTEDGEGFNTSPMAAYPPKMCEFLAKLIYNDCKENIVMGMRKSPCGSGSTSGVRTTTTPRKRISFKDEVKTVETQARDKSMGFEPSQARHSPFSNTPHKSHHEVLCEC